MFHMKFIENRYRPLNSRLIWIFQFCLLIKKALILWKTFFRDFCQDTQNVCACVRVCVCFKTYANWSFCNSGSFGCIIRLIELKLGEDLKQTTPFLWYCFRWNWFMDWDFMTWIFWKTSVNALAAENFKRSS